MSINNSEQEDKLEELFHNTLGLCGCGRPDEVKLLLFKLLSNQQEFFQEKIPYEEYAANREHIMKSTDLDILFEFIFHVLDHKKFLQHGSSIYGAWLTEQGEELLQLLKENICTNLS